MGLSNKPRTSAALFATLAAVSSTAYAGLFGGVKSDLMDGLNAEIKAGRLNHCPVWLMDMNTEFYVAPSVKAQEQFEKYFGDFKQAGVLTVEKVDVGALDKASKQKEPATYGWGFAKLEGKAYRAALTPEARGRLTKNAGIPSLCYPGVKVREIIEYTEPAPANGVIVSKVTFSFDLSGITEPAMKTWVAKSMADKEASKRTITLAKTSNGWRWNDDDYESSRQRNSIRYAKWRAQMDNEFFK